MCPGLVLQLDFSQWLGVERWGVLHGGRSVLPEVVVCSLPCRAVLLRQCWLWMPRWRFSLQGCRLFARGVPRCVPVCVGGGCVVKGVGMTVGAAVVGAGVLGGGATGVPQGWLVPVWPAPRGVRALFTTRAGGCSLPPWDSMNLGDHVGDNPLHVAANRAALAACLQAAAAPQSMGGGVGSAECGAPAAMPDFAGGPEQVVRPVFLRQVHGCDVLELAAGTVPCGPLSESFDACMTTQPGVACVVMVADCLPVLLAHGSGLCVAAAHAGWRGLAGVGMDGQPGGSGVLERLWQHFCARVRTLPGHAGVGDAAIAAATCVWLGPCIGPGAFEVGAEVRHAFVRHDGRAAACFVPVGAPGLEDAGASLSEDTTRGGAGQHEGGLWPQGKLPQGQSVNSKWLADLPGLARLRLQALGLEAVYGNDGSAAWCTYSNPAAFFSHRRDAGRLGTTGRMAAVVWMEGGAGRAVR